jgi:hypothetical protein
MPDSPEIKVRLTAEDQGVSAAIRQLGDELKRLKQTQDDVSRSSEGTSRGFASIKQAASEMASVLKAGVPGLGNLPRELDDKFRAANLAMGGAAGAVTTLGVAALAVTHHMMGLAQSISNTAAATGLSRTQVQEYNELAKEMDVDAQSLQTAFARIQTQLGQFITSGRAAGTASQSFVRVMKEMKVDLTDVQGKLRPVNDILGDFSDALAKIPDQETRTAIEMAALGTRGRVLAQVIEEANRAGVSLRDTLASIDKSGNVIPDSQLDNLLEAKHRWDELMRSVRGVKTEIEGFIALAVTHPAEVARALNAGPMMAGPALATSLAAGAVAGHAAASSTGNALLVGQIAEQNEKLSERLEILRAGGELQLQLQQAEASYAAALKSHNTELAKQYGQEVTQLREILGLEAAKKGHREPERAPQLLDAAARAELSLALKQQQDLFAVWKAGAAERAAVEKEQYERGLLTISQYFDQRRALIQEETRKEIGVLTAERTQVQAAATAAGERAAAATGAIPTAASPEEKRELTTQADRFTAEQLQGLARVDELNARIAEAEIQGRTRAAELEGEQFRAEEEHKRKILELQKEIDAQPAKATEEALRLVEIQRREIAIELKDHKITAEQAEQRERDLVASQIPLLRQKAQLELQSAQASGDQARIQQAQEHILQIQQLNTQLSKTRDVGKEVSAGLTQDFTKFFEAIPQGTRAIGQAFGQMELQVIRSLMNVAAQMVVNALLHKSINADTRLDDAKTAAANTWESVSQIPVVGWILAPIAAAAAFAGVLALAEGGPVSGPGGPREDRVPAMLSAGEYVMNAGAVKSFGARNLEAINAGLSPNFAASIARPSDFRTPSFALPAEVAGGPREVHMDNSIGEIHLHHNGPDARQVLEEELVPMLLKARRMGSLPEYP